MLILPLRINTVRETELISESYSGHARSLGSYNGSVQAGFSFHISTRRGETLPSLSMRALLMVASGDPPNI